VVGRGVACDPPAGAMRIAAIGFTHASGPFPQLG
jgi:hypothetical protein